MIRSLPNSLLDRSGLISRADFFFPSHLVLWVTCADTVRELIRSAPGHDLMVAEGADEERQLWVRKGHGHWVGLILKEID